MEHQKADVRPATGRGTSGDDAARFLRELRELRNGAGLGRAELAARAHFPYDSIRAAEVGPSLPDLPVLCAFVRGCGGTTEEWEERWRSLTKSPSLPVSGTRQSGQSDAATAGARIGLAAQPGDRPDPSVIIAALNRVAEEMAGPGGPDAVPVPPAGRLSPDLASPSLPPDKPGAGDKPTGWDPIRVSAAWPALKHTPATAEPTRGPKVSVGVGVPWDAVPGGTDSAGATSSASSGAAGSGAVGASPDGARMSASATSGEVVSRVGAARSPRTALLVVAVILLCVLAVLLGVFA